MNLDINECVTSNGGCEHQCKNTNGSYICQCKNGFFLDGNAKTCSGKFYFKTKRHIRKSWLYNGIIYILIWKKI